MKRAKLGRLRSHIHFGALLTDLIRSDNAGLLEQLLSPVLLPHIKKRFTLDSLDEALTVKPKQAEAAEKVEEEPPQEIQFADEMEDQRIRKNYTFLMNNLLAAFEKRDTFTLSEFGAAMSRMYSPDILKNADYYSFFVNLCQKQEYVIGGQTENESFLDDILAAHLQTVNRYILRLRQNPQERRTNSQWNSLNWCLNGREQSNGKQKYRKGTGNIRKTGGGGNGKRARGRNDLPCIRNTVPTGKCMIWYCCR